MTPIYSIKKAFLELDGIEELERDVCYDSFWWRSKDQSIVVRTMGYDSIAFLPLCRDNLTHPKAEENLKGLYQNVKRRISEVRIEKQKRAEEKREKEKIVENCIDNFLNFVKKG